MNVLLSDLHTRLNEYEAARTEAVSEGDQRQTTWYAAKSDLLQDLIADYS